MDKIYKTDKTFISIDPALNNTGLALWYPGDKYPWIRSIATKGTKQEKGRQLWEWLRQETPVTEGCTTYIEYPKYFAGSPIGQAAATRGDLGTTLLAAHICMVVGWEAGIEVVLVPVNEWKGQLSKQATKIRVDKILPDVVCRNSHEYDAVGIGLFVRGEF